MRGHRHPTGAGELPLVLRNLDRRVAADPGHPGFAGTICFGVHTPRGVRWWLAESDGQKVSTSFPLTLPDDFQVGVALEEDQVNQESLCFDPETCLVTGNKELLGRFASRYLKEGDSSFSQPHTHRVPAFMAAESTNTNA